jgi:hypothetical protein
VHAILQLEGGSTLSETLCRFFITEPSQHFTHNTTSYSLLYSRRTVSDWLRSPQDRPIGLRGGQVCAPLTSSSWRPTGGPPPACRSSSSNSNPRKLKHSLTRHTSMSPKKPPARSGEPSASPPSTPLAPGAQCAARGSPGRKQQATCFYTAPAGISRTRTAISIAASAHPAWARCCHGQMKQAPCSIGDLPPPRAPCQWNGTT